eukprot:Opistho-2@85675
MSELEVPASQPARPETPTPIEAKRKCPLISYQDDYGLWPQLSKGFARRIPFPNVTWRSMSTGRQQLIESLNIELVPFVPGLASKSDGMGGVSLDHQQPFVHVYLVNCDDVDVYKQTVKGKIQSWLNYFKDNSKIEWLIIYVDRRGPGQKMPKLQLRSVFDKLKSDFASKPERCVQLRIADGDSKSDETWDDVINKMRDSVLACFDRRVAQYEEDIKRTLGNRQLPGWNFLNFFILKEGLAYAFEMMKLYEEAFFQYVELEFLYRQVEATDKSQLGGKLPVMEWFGGTDAGDDSGSVLDLTRKPYREMIRRNTIKSFDFRNYLFACQFRLLLHLGRPVEAAERAHAFALVVGRKLRENASRLMRHFAESWTFSFCTEVVAECDHAVAQLSPALEGDLRARYQMLRGDLAYTARKRLDALGIAYGHLPRELPFSLNAGSNAISVVPPAPASSEPPTAPTASTTALGVPASTATAPAGDAKATAFSSVNDPLGAHSGGGEGDEEPMTLYPPIAGGIAGTDAVAKISNAQLVSATATAVEFDRLYEELSQMASESYAAANRQRGALRVNRDLGALRFCRKEFARAEWYYATAHRTYAEDGWLSLDYDIRKDLAFCQRNLGKLEDCVDSYASLLAPASSLTVVERQATFDDLIVIAKSDLKSMYALAAGPLLKPTVVAARKVDANQPDDLQLSQSQMATTVEEGSAGGIEGATTTTTATTIAAASTTKITALEAGRMARFDIGDAIEIEIAVDSLLPGSLVCERAGLALARRDVSSVMSAAGPAGMLDNMSLGPASRRPSEVSVSPSRVRAETEESTRPPPLIASAAAISASSAALAPASPVLSGVSAQLSAVAELTSAGEDGVATDNRRSTHDSARSMGMEIECVDVHPGPNNTILFSGIVTCGGDFVFDRIWVDVGNLRLTRSLGPTDGLRGLSFGPTRSSVTVEVFLPPSTALIAGSPVNMNIAIRTNADSITGGTLEVSSSTGLRIDAVPSGLLSISRPLSQQQQQQLQQQAAASELGASLGADGLKRSGGALLTPGKASRGSIRRTSVTPLPVAPINAVQAGVSRRIPFSFSDGVLQLPECGPNEVVEFALPVYANDKELKHKVTFVLSYTKTTAETFTRRLTVPLRFVNPFVASHTLIVSRSRVFVHAMVQCNAPVPLKLLGVDMSVQPMRPPSSSDEWKAADCPANKVIEGIVALPQQKVSTVLILERETDDVAGDKAQPGFDTLTAVAAMSYSFVRQHREERFTFTYPMYSALI